MDLGAIEGHLGELKTHIEWIRSEMEKNDKKYAPFWIKYPVYAMCAGALGWTGNQILQLIETAKALFN